MDQNLGLNRIQFKAKCFGIHQVNPVGGVENRALLITHLYKVSKGAKIRNRYNQVPHLTQDTLKAPAKNAFEDVVC